MSAGESIQVQSLPPDTTTGNSTSFYNVDNSGAPTDVEHVVLYATLSLFSVVGAIGNAIAFSIFFQRRNSGTSVIFILALAGTDFITSLVTIPFTIIFEAVQYNLRYDFMCKAYMFFICSTIPYSSLVMGAIAFDRYFCICHPFKHVFTLNRARFIVLALAVPAFAFGIITGLNYGIYYIHDSLITNGSYLLGTTIPKERAMHPLVETTYISFNDTEALRAGVQVTKEIMFENDSNVYHAQVLRQMFVNPQCVKNFIYFDEQFQIVYHYVYTSCYALCFFVVIVLYVLIYKFIHDHRAMKAKRRKKKTYTSVANTEPQVHLTQPAPREAETAMTELTGNGNITTTLTSTHNAIADTSFSTPAANNGVKNTNGTHSHANDAGETSTAPRRRPSTRDRNANIKTAAMLFVVTLVFILAFLPSWLMAHQILPIQLNVFYFYFVYNVANPFIYAFMNQSFREDLKKFLKR